MIFQKKTLTIHILFYIIFGGVIISLFNMYIFSVFFMFAMLLLSNRCYVMIISYVYITKTASKMALN